MRGMRGGVEGEWEDEAGATGRSALWIACLAKNFHEGGIRSRRDHATNKNVVLANP